MPIMTNKGGKGLDGGLVIAMGLPPRSLLSRVPESIEAKNTGQEWKQETVELGSNFRRIDAVTVRVRASWQHIFEKINGTMVGFDLHAAAVRP
jgi:hypothetical protein